MELAGKIVCSTSPKIEKTTMTAISVTNVNVLDNPSKVTNPLQFEIQYECITELSDGE